MTTAATLVDSYSTSGFVTVADDSTTEPAKSKKVVYTASLSDGDSVTFTVPVGTRYKVDETDTMAHGVQYSVSGSYNCDNERSVPLVGQAFAVLDDDGKLTFLRSLSTTEYENGVDGTITDIDGVVHTGKIYPNVENTAAYSNKELMAMDDDTYDAAIIAMCPWDMESPTITEVAIAGSQVIRPHACMYWFSGMGITTCDLPLDTSNVTSMNGMFAGCVSLISLDVSKFNTENVTDMSYMFYVCRSLTSLDVSDWNVSNVTDMSRMFFDSNESIRNESTIAGWNITPSTNQTEMFGCNEGSPMS